MRISLSPLWSDMSSLHESLLFEFRMIHMTCTRYFAIHNQELWR
jgi:hypothetical protein